MDARLDAEATPPAAGENTTTRRRRSRRIIRVSRTAIPASMMRVRAPPSGGAAMPGITAAAATAAAATATTSPLLHILPYNANYRTPIVDLQPQPLPEQQQQTIVPPTKNLEPYRLEAAESSPSSPLLRSIPVDARAEGLECNICYTVLQEPVGCGTPACSARFCLSCWAQAHSTRQRPATTTTQEQQQCPVCRSTPVTATKDTVLAEKLQQGIYVACPHCGDTKIPYPQIENHTAKVCPGVHVACRLALFGCNWTGPRGDNHRATCPLEPIAETFLERFRKEHVTQQQQNYQLLAQLAYLRTQLNTRLREPQQTTTATVKDPRNPADVLSFFVARMLRRREGSIGSNWIDEASMWNSIIARATVLQTLALIPTWCIGGVELRSSLMSPAAPPQLLATSCIAIILFLQFLPGRNAVVWRNEPRIVPAVAASGMGYIYLFFFSKVSTGVALARFTCLCYASLVLPLALFRASLPPEIFQQQRAGWEEDVKNCTAFGVVKMGLVIATVVQLLWFVGCPKNLTIVFWLISLLVVYLENYYARVVRFAGKVVCGILALSLVWQYAVSAASYLLGLPVLFTESVPLLLVVAGIAYWAMTAFAFLFLMLSLMNALDNAAITLGTNVRGGRTGTLSDSMGLAAMLGWGMALLFLTV